jgi:hypothetical protein
MLTYAGVCRLIALKFDGTLRWELNTSSSIEGEIIEVYIWYMYMYIYILWSSTPPPPSRVRLSRYIYIILYVYVYICIYCVCVCDILCVCVCIYNRYNIYVCISIYAHDMIRMRRQGLSCLFRDKPRLYT